jgi:hypothetical protein
MSELRKSKNNVAPSSGARQAAGKHSDPDANLQFGDKKSEEVKTLPLESDNDGHEKAMDAQNNGNILTITQKNEEAIRATRKAINRKALGK